MEAAEQIVRECRVTERLTDRMDHRPGHRVRLVRLGDCWRMVAQLPVLDREVRLGRSEGGKTSPNDCDLVKPDEQNLGLYDRQHLLGAQDRLIRAIATGAS